MSRYFSYLNSAIHFIENYAGDLPLAIYLKKRFAESKKYGSNDRRQISELVFSYFRIASGLKNNSIEEAILVATFLCNQKNSKVIENIKPEWSVHQRESVGVKKQLIGIEINDEDIFPFGGALSKGVEIHKFAQSFFIQPDFFLRIRNENKISITNSLTNNNIGFTLINESCLAFENGTNVDQFIKIGEEAIVQDYSSQQVGEIMGKYINHEDKKLTVWDCCAASGGKSIMLYDINNQINLTVSDIRESILENLKGRFQLAGIKNYKSYIIDLSTPKHKISDKFNFILADVPCTGSGTWARTPEEKHFFNVAKIEEFANLQYSIVSNILSNLKESGILFYITCSIFEKENERQIEKLVKNNSLKLIEQKMLIGFENRADSMFVAVLQKIIEPTNKS